MILRNSFSVHQNLPTPAQLPCALKASTSCFPTCMWARSSPSQHSLCLAPGMMSIGGSMEWGNFTWLFAWGRLFAPMSVACSSSRHWAVMVWRINSTHANRSRVLSKCCPKKDLRLPYKSWMLKSYIAIFMPEIWNTIPRTLGGARLPRRDPKNFPGRILWNVRSACCPSRIIRSCACNAIGGMQTHKHTHTHTYRERHRFIL